MSVWKDANQLTFWAGLTPGSNSSNGKKKSTRITKGGHYIFLYGAKTQNGVKKVYVFDPNGSNKYVNVLFPLRRSSGGIEVAKRGQGADFGISEKI